MKIRHRSDVAFVLVDGSSFGKRPICQMTTTHYNESCEKKGTEVSKIDRK